MASYLRWSIRVGASLFWFGCLFFPYSGVAQEPDILFNQVTVTRDEASLVLEFVGGEEISAEMADGEMRLNGEEVGRYAPGDDVERSWRTLLAEAISGSPDEVHALIRDWRLPETLGSSARRGAEMMKEGLGGTRTSTPLDPPSATYEPNLPSLSALEALLLRSDRLRTLATVIDEANGGDFSLYVGEDVVISAGETIDGSLLLVDGSLQLDGTIEGDVVLLGAQLTIGEDGRVAGTVRTTDADISGDLDQVEGGVTESMAAIEAVVSTATQDVEEVVRDVVREATEDARRDSRDGVFGSGMSSFRSLGRGIARLFRTVVTFGIMFASGLALLYFFPRHLETVSQASRRVTGRSLIVGLAGLVIAVPIWIVGAVLLAISIIGIPLLLVWVPAVPLALVGAMVFGYVGVARNLGGWLSRRDLRGVGGFDATRPSPAVQIGTGLMILLAAYALANVFEMGGPLFGVFEGLFLFMAIAATMAATSIGLGSVILSRAGRSPDFDRVPWRRSPPDSTGSDDASPEG